MADADLEPTSLEPAVVEVKPTSLEPAVVEVQPAAVEPAALEVEPQDGLVSIAMELCKLVLSLGEMESNLNNPILQQHEQPIQ